MSQPSTDEQFLRGALELALRGVGLASPNPYVGAVIVDQHREIVGTGTYTYEGLRHAEVIALQQAAGKARGATLYINLEPHSHQGRTPPCTEALIKAGIQRVVASMPDPNPKVSGRGFEKLREAGVQLDVGQLEAEARRVNEAFARYIVQGRPLVTLKAAMTIDAKIAPRALSGRTSEVPAEKWITGEAARAHVQQQRHQSDAILVGLGTILADDPLLTDRSGNPRRRPLLRVILDTRLRLPLESRIVRSVTAKPGSKGEGEVMIFTSFPNEEKKLALESRGIRVEQVSPDADGHPDIDAVVRRLGQLEIASLMIEGGSAINSAALASGVVDKIFVYYAPKIFGAGAVPFACARRFDKFPLELKHVRTHRFNDDIALEGYLRDPYEE